jgi:VanZ family protein
MKNRHYQIAAWACLASIVFVTVSPIQMRPGDILSVDVDRALAFGLMASAFMIAYPRHALAVGVLVVASAGLMEFLQLLTPSRHARIEDALVKVTGATGGMAIGLIYNILRSARHQIREWRMAEESLKSCRQKMA